MTAALSVAAIGTVLTKVKSAANCASGRGAPVWPGASAATVAFSSASADARATSRAAQHSTDMRRETGRRPSVSWLANSPAACLSARPAAPVPDSRERRFRRGVPRALPTHVNIVQPPAKLAARAAIDRPPGACCYRAAPRHLPEAAWAGRFGLTSSARPVKEFSPAAGNGSAGARFLSHAPSTV